MRGVSSWGSFCLFFFCHVAALRATVVIPRRLEDLAQRAPVVVHGKVVQIDVSSHNGYRTAIVEANEVVRAPVEFRQERDFYIPLANRAIPFRSLVEVIPAAPELLLGEELVLFLRPVPAGREGPYRRNDGRRLFALEGFQQGKARVFSDSEGIRRLATWDTVPDVELSGPELQKQKTTARLSSKSQPRALAVPADLKESCRSLDSILNLARGAAQ